MREIQEYQEVLGKHQNLNKKTGHYEKSGVPTWPILVPTWLKYDMCIYVQDHIHNFLTGSQFVTDEQSCYAFNQNICLDDLSVPSSHRFSPSALREPHAGFFSVVLHKPRIDHGSKHRDMLEFVNFRSHIPSEPTFPSG